VLFAHDDAWEHNWVIFIVNVALSFANDIRGCNDKATGLFLVGGHICWHALARHACADVAFVDVALSHVSTHDMTSKRVLCWSTDNLVRTPADDGGRGY